VPHVDTSCLHPCRCRRHMSMTCTLLHLHTPDTWRWQVTLIALDGPALNLFSIYTHQHAKTRRLLFFRAGISTPPIWHGWCFWLLMWSTWPSGSQRPQVCATCLLHEDAEGNQTKCCNMDTPQTLSGLARHAFGPLPNVSQRCGCRALQTRARVHDHFHLLTYEHHCTPYLPHRT
jgi:hypothetical protein